MLEILTGEVKPLSTERRPRYQRGMIDTALSLMMLAVAALVIGAIFLLRRGGARKQALLMLLLALIMAGNVAIWSLPDPQGASLRERAPAQ